MRCDYCQLVIEEYFDGELDEQVALQVRHHLDGCSSCSSLLDELSAEEKVYSRGASEVEINPELWAGVHARIAPRRSASPERLRLSAAFALPRINAWTAAALVIVAIGLTAVFMKYVVRPDQPTGLSSARETPSGTPASLQEKPALVAENKSVAEPLNVVNRPTKAAAGRSEGVSIASHKTTASRLPHTSLKTKTPEQLVREAEQKYLAAITMLSRTVSRRQSQVDPVTRAKLEQALVSIDRTIASTRRVVHRHPDDPVAVQYMLTAYAKKVDVLRQMSNY